MSTKASVGASPQNSPQELPESRRTTQSIRSRSPSPLFRPPVVGCFQNASSAVVPPAVVSSARSAPSIAQYAMNSMSSRASVAPAATERIRLHSPCHSPKYGYVSSAPLRQASPLHSYVGPTSPSQSYVGSTFAGNLAQEARTTLQLAPQQVYSEQGTEPVVSLMKLLLGQYEEKVLNRISECFHSQSATWHKQWVAQMGSERKFMADHIEACFKDHRDHQEDGQKQTVTYLKSHMEEHHERLKEHYTSSISDFYDVVKAATSEVDPVSRRSSARSIVTTGLQEKGDTSKRLSRANTRSENLEEGGGTDVYHALRAPLLEQTTHQGAEEMVESLKNPQSPPESILGKVAHSSTFEYSFQLVIALNSVFLGFVAQRSVEASYKGTATDLFCDVGDKMFIILFSVELIIRLGAFGIKGFFCGLHRNWNTFDMVLVVCALPDLLPQSDGETRSNVTFLRCLRLVRLMKLLRVARVASLMCELRKLLHSIMASLPTLFWSMILLAVILYIFTLVLIQSCLTIFADVDVPDSVKGNFFKHFGTIYNTMLTLFMCAFGGEDWGRIADLLLLSGSAYYYLFLFYIVFMNLAIMNVIMGLFVDAAMKAAEKDRLAAMKDAADDIWELKKEILNLFDSYDTSHDGVLDKEELLESYKHPAMKAFLDHIEVDPLEVDTLWAWMEMTNPGQVKIAEFVEGCFRMGRNAKSIDILHLGHKQDQVHELLVDIQEMLQPAGGCC